MLQGGAESDEDSIPHVGLGIVERHLDRFGNVLLEGALNQQDHLLGLLDTHGVGDGLDLSVKLRYLFVDRPVRIRKQDCLSAVVNLVSAADFSLDTTWTKVIVEFAAHAFEYIALERGKNVTVEVLDLTKKKGERDELSFSSRSRRLRL